MEKSNKISFKSLLARLALLLAVGLLFTSCNKSIEEKIDGGGDPPMSLGSFFLLNEGQYGVSKGSLNYYQYGQDKIQPTDLKFGETTSYGVLWFGHYYFVSKQANRLVKVDQATMKQVAATENIGGGDGRSFAGVTEDRGVVTTSAGAYVVDLKTLEIVGEKLEKSGRQCGAVYVSDKNIFIINADKGIFVYDLDFKLVQNLGGEASVGFVKSKDGSLWAAKATSRFSEGSALLKINTTTLEMETIPLPTGIDIYDSWVAWNKGSLCASSKENVLYFPTAKSDCRSIYRYEIGNPESLKAPFATTEREDDALYGSGISVDPKSDDIILTLVKAGLGDNYSDNRIAIIDPITGKEKKCIKYSGFYFPGMIIFNDK